MSRCLNGVLGMCVVVGFTLSVPADVFAQSPSIPSVPVKVTNAPTVTVGNPASNPVPITGTVQVTGTPTVELGGTPTVVVANQPSAGMVYAEVLGVSINVNGGVAGPAGYAVPSGWRRIITTVSACWACDAGHRALIQIFGNAGLFLPGQFVYTDSMGRDTYAMVSQVNIVHGPGTQWVPIIESDGANCLADIFLSGVYVPDQP